jgi:hypothetical protein
MNRFSTDIARGDICRARWQDRYVKIISSFFLSVTKEHVKRVIRPSLKCRSGGSQLEDFRKEIFSCSFVANRRNTPLFSGAISSSNLRRKL